MLTWISDNLIRYANTCYSRIVLLINTDKLILQLACQNVTGPVNPNQQLESLELTLPQDWDRFCNIGNIDYSILKDTSW